MTDRQREITEYYESMILGDWVIDFNKTLKNPYPQIERPKIEIKKEERAKCLIASYDREDEKYKRGKCLLTPEWVVENIFTQSCHYCGESDWHKLGADRVDNSLPHTPDNVVPCCRDCNKKKGRKTYDYYMKIIRKKKGG